MRHSVGVLADSTGKLLATARMPHTMSLHTTDPDELVVRLQELLLALTRAAGLEFEKVAPVARLCVGMSGVTYAFDRMVVLPGILRDQLDCHFAGLACTGDAEITFASHTQSSTGSLVISHSGSTAYVVGERDGLLHHYRYGGWGPSLADEGSGFWIGREALRAIFLAHDEHGLDNGAWRDVRAWLLSPDTSSTAWKHASLLWSDLLREFKAGSAAVPNMDERTLLYRFTNQLCADPSDDGLRKAVAGIAIPVMRAFESDPEDSWSTPIVDRALDELIRQHLGALAVAKRRKDLTRASPVVLYGGVFNWNRRFREKYAERLTQRIGESIKIVTSHDDRTMRPVMGALMFALAGSESGRLCLPDSSMVERLLEQHKLSPWEKDLAND